MCIRDRVTRDSDPESAAATEAFGTFLHEVNEDIARALGSLRAQRQATYSASSPARHVTVTVNSGGVLPVSYTHLDVYKRQTQDRLGVGEQLVGVRSEI